MVANVMPRLQHGFTDRYILFAINVLVLDGLRQRGLFISNRGSGYGNAGWLDHGCLRPARGNSAKQRVPWGR